MVRQLRQSCLTNHRPLRRLTFLLILLIAFFFRFYRLADHPLGIFFDPAINGLDAVRLIERGGVTPFFPTNGGREALFVYLLTPFIHLFGTTPFALRLLPALISLLTVALLIGFLNSVRFPLHLPLTSATQLSGANVRFWLATLAGLVLAVSYWHISISRLPFRAILLPAVALPLFWFFLKGWSTGYRGWFILAGCCLGLAGYTYAAARLLPVILGLVILPEFFTLITKKSTDTRHHPSIPNLQSPISNLLIFLLTAALIYLPMAWYFLTHPAQFTARATSVLVWNFLDTPGQIIAELGRNTLRVAGFFCCAGSPNPLFGLPGYPGAPLILAPFLLTGLLIALRRWRDLFHRLIALWWLIGLLPSLIAIEAPHPLRLIVALVPTALLIALGSLHLALWLSSQKPIPPHFTFYILRFTFCLILLTTPFIFRAYFIDWTRLQTTQGAYNYSAVAIRNAILDLPTEETPVYLPLIRFNDTPLLFYLSGSFPRQTELTPTPANRAWLVTPVDQESSSTWLRLYRGKMSLIPPLTGEGQRLIQTALNGSETGPVHTASGETVAHIAPLADDPARFVQQPTDPVEAVFGPVRLTGLTYPERIDPAAGTIPVTLFWEAVEPVSDEYEIILQLVDDRRRSWGDGSGRPTGWVYPTSFWRPGLDEVAARQTIITEAETLPPGRYWLAIAIFDPAKNRRLPLTAGRSDSPDTFFAGPLKVPLPPPQPAQTATLNPPDRDVTFGQAIQLAALTIEPTTIAAGETITLDLLWQAKSRPDRDYTIFIHLLDAEGNLVAGNDTQPLNGGYPTSIWSDGERLLDPHILPTPAGLPPGQYRLAVGFYHHPSGERLPLHLAGKPVTNDGRLILSQPITIDKQ